MVGETNQDGVETLYGYDGSGRLTSVTNAVNTAEAMVTRYQYDELGNETAQIDGLNRTNLYLYDAMNRRIWHELPTNSLVERFNYDLAGNLVLQTNFNGAVITNQYDGLNRLTNRMSIGGYFVTYGYVKTGQRAVMDDLSGVTTYQYDNRLRLTQKNETLTNYFFMGISYGYDANGNVTDIHGSHDQTYQFDALNRLVGVGGHMQATYSYDGAGNLQGMTYGGNTLTNFYQYDALNRLTNLVWMTNGNVTANLAASFAYQMKAGGTRTNTVEMINGITRTSSWSYDHLYRLTGEAITGLGTNGYQYDTVGNRTSRQSNVLSPGTYSYNGNDRLTTDQYDPNGNTTNSAGTNYVYDVMNELTSANGGQVQCWYDGDGNRVMKSVGGFTNVYCVDDRNPSGYAQVIDEYTNNAGSGWTWSRLYDYGLGLLGEDEVQAWNGMRYCGLDGHGNVRFLVEASYGPLNGTITEMYSYDGYGSVLSQWSAYSGPSPYEYLYCAQQWDPDLGLYYNRARYLNTDSGRFLSSDNLNDSNDDPLSLNKYLYCQANPVDGIDPSGHFDIDSMMMPVFSRVIPVLQGTLTQSRCTVTGGFSGVYLRAATGQWGQPFYCASGDYRLLPPGGVESTVTIVSRTNPKIGSGNACNTINDPDPSATIHLYLRNPYPGNYQILIFSRIHMTATGANGNAEATLKAGSHILATPCCTPSKPVDDSQFYTFTTYVGTEWTLVSKYIPTISLAADKGVKNTATAYGMLDFIGAIKQ